MNDDEIDEIRELIEARIDNLSAREQRRLFGGILWRHLVFGKADARAFVAKQLHIPREWMEWIEV